MFFLSVHSKPWQLVAPCPSAHVALECGCSQTGKAIPWQFPACKTMRVLLLVVFFPEDVCEGSFSRVLDY